MLSEYHLDYLKRTELAVSGYQILILFIITPFTRDHIILGRSLSAFPSTTVMIPSFVSWFRYIFLSPSFFAEKDRRSWNESWPSSSRKWRSSILEWGGGAPTGPNGSLFDLRLVGPWVEREMRWGQVLRRVQN
jgi:hypothetical protein